LAYKDHGSCWNCEEPICAGDEYKGEVYTFGPRLWVRKTHWPENCHPPDDTDEYEKWDEIRRKEEAASESEQRSQQVA
jgi:hypothetical protein